MLGGFGGSPNVSAPAPDLVFWRTTWLSQIACSSQMCMAMGSRPDTSNTSRVITSALHGSIWTRLQSDSVPLPTNGNPVDSLSCAPNGNCIALGNLGDRLLILSRTHGKWSSNHLVYPQYEMFYNDQVATCSPAGLCWAVLDSTDLGAVAIGVINGHWLAPKRLGVFHSRVPAPNQRTFVSGVSCYIPNACSVVGSVRNTAGAPRQFFIQSVVGDQGIADARPKLCRGAQA